MHQRILPGLNRLCAQRPQRVQEMEEEAMKKTLIVAGAVIAVIVVLFVILAVAG